MRFFVPNTRDSAQAEEVLAGVRSHVTQVTGWDIGEARIFRLVSQRGGETIELQVGKPHPHDGEEVLVILESEAFLVCTLSRGVGRDSPFLVDKEGAVVEYFDGE